jgi:hypothetical protein
MGYFVENTSAHILSLSQLSTLELASDHRIGTSRLEAPDNRTFVLRSLRYCVCIGNPSIHSLGKEAIGRGGKGRGRSNGASARHVANHYIITSHIAAFQMTWLGLSFEGKGNDYAV